MTLDEALEILASVHTRQTTQAYLVEMAATPSAGLEQSYVEAWGVVVDHLKTVPEAA